MLDSRSAYSSTCVSEARTACVLPPFFRSRKNPAATRTTTASTIQPFLSFFFFRRGLVEASFISSIDCFCSFMRGIARKANNPQNTAYQHTPKACAVPKVFVNIQIHFRYKSYNFYSLLEIGRTKAPGLSLRRFAVFETYSVIIRIISLSVSRMPTRPRRLKFAIEFSTPLATSPSPP